jgi:hypothetical protein
MHNYMKLPAEGSIFMLNLNQFYNWIIENLNLEKAH